MIIMYSVGGKERDGSVDINLVETSMIELKYIGLESVGKAEEVV